ncbi:TPA: integrase arm-type DNA-binding domain-containing protein [Providencia alcalifaciens]
MTNRLTGINLLTYTEVAAIKPKEKDYSVSDGGGLLLYIKKSGSKTWRYR